MKLIMAVLSLLVCATVTCAQNPDPAKWMCRNLADSGGFAYQGESIFGTQACRPIPQAAASAQAAASPTTVSTTTPAAQAQPAPAQQPDPPAPEQPTQDAPVAKGQQPRVFLQSTSHGNTWNARRDQSMEMSKDFAKVCPGVRVTINQQVADYTVLLNHIELGLFARDNQVQVADKNGDLLKTREGGGIKGSVKNVCDLILADWARQ
jgi:hypothetical protein